MFKSLKNIDVENYYDLRHWLIGFLIKIFFAIGVFSFVENYINGYYYNLIPDSFIVIGAIVLYYLYKSKKVSDETLASIGVYFTFLIAYLGLLMYIIEIPQEDFPAIFFWIFPVVIVIYTLKNPDWAFPRNLLFFVIFITTLIIAEVLFKKTSVHMLIIFAFVYLITIVGLYMYAKYVYALQGKLKEKHKKVLENEQKFRALAENAPIGIAVIEDRKLIYLNRYMFPLKLKEKKTLEKILTQDYIPDEVELKHQGKLKKFLISKADLDFDKKQIRIITLTDISEEIKLREEIDKAKQFFQNIAEKSPIGIVIYKQTIEYINKKFLDTIGYRPQEVIGKYVLDFIPDEYAEIKKQLKNALELRLKGESLDVNYIIPIKTKDGVIKWFYLTAHTLKQNSDLKGMAVIIDITEQKKLEEKIFTLENLDLDTGLPNRKILIQEADFLIKRKTPFAIVVIDINGFVEIQKIYGKEKAKKLIKEIVNRLQTNLSNIILGKIGMDRFVVIKTIKDSKDLNQFIFQKLLKQFEEPFVINGSTIPVTVNLGISVYPQDGEEADKLCSNAEFALKLSKLKGKKEIEFFSEETKNMVETRFDLITKLKKAVEQKEFKILYQPKVFLKDHRFDGCEALIRWKLPPDKFIPVLTEEKMLSITHKIIFNQIFQQIRNWLDRGLDIRVSLNLPFSEIEKQEFYEEFLSLIEKHKIHARNIVIEITETEIMRSPQHSLKILEKLKKEGFGISIDDFGIGYSSLSYLAQIPADEIKIDISFVQKIPEDKNVVEIIKIIVDIGKILNMKVTAEGIENKEQYEFLKKIGCDVGQGFYISKPLTPEELEKFYKEHTLQK
ncbi:MAG: EAL domain-containing protein [Aquificae bacterium]|nr:EAL domain-containing protein [Aquificota bacterium]